MQSALPWPQGLDTNLSSLRTETWTVSHAPRAGPGLRSPGLQALSRSSQSELEFRNLAASQFPKNCGATTINILELNFIIFYNVLYV